jgi:diaminohydroxyphosphoribosylaminopyrimidine deaminase/5-amino-6-(5-phosphoribosylamino)uracil reductase
MHDAILVGTETALADDPELTCRLPGLADRSPVRIVLDRQGRIPFAAKLVTGARETPTWIVTSHHGDPAYRDKLEAAGAEILVAAVDEAGRLDLSDVLQQLGRRGLTRLLVEGGGQLAAALLQVGLVDRLVLFHAPLLLGGDGIPGIAALGLPRLAAAPRFERIGGEPSGADISADTVSLFRVKRETALRE